MIENQLERDWHYITFRNSPRHAIGYPYEENWHIWILRDWLPADDPLWQTIDQPDDFHSVQLFAAPDDKNLIIGDRIAWCEIEVIDRRGEYFIEGNWDRPQFEIQAHIDYALYWLRW